MSDPESVFTCENCGRRALRSQRATTEDGEFLHEDLHCSHCQKLFEGTITPEELTGFPVSGRIQ
jgi:hypothetical protein